MRVENGKRILVLLGSPRKKGNSTTLAKQIVKGAESAGAEVETIYLNGLKIKPCQGCYGCKKKDSKGCVVKDDMQPLYPKIVAADALVIATPVYWFNMTAQTKIFMDRCYGLFDASFTVNPLLKKRIGIAMSYGDTDPFNSGCVNALRSFQDAFTYVGAKIDGMVYGSAEEPGEISSNAVVMQQAEDLGRKIARV